MAWEERRGRRYYYRKRRVQGRVVSAYLGTGATADIVSGIDAAERIEREAGRDEERAQRAELRREDEGVDELMEITEAFAAAALLVAGCHTHKGTWRRTR